MRCMHWWLAQVDSECTQGDRQSMQNMVEECVNILGGRTCGECPSGYRGSGYTQCTLASPCNVDNGGCDRLVTCLDTTAGVPECGPCPEGYTGTGTTGCLDEDGCAAAAAEGGGCYPGVACADAPAPASGYTCGTCPVGMDGDGTDCRENLCFNANGGCSPRASCTNDPSHPAGRVCGACPEGYSDEYADGTSCVDTDGCAAGSCFPGVACTDVAAPGTGAACGDCPGGYSGDGATCNDVDECAGGDNGGCDAVTPCVNVFGGRECGECPEGFMGTGEAGCRRTQTCDVDNGGCHELTTCTDVWDGVECGDCPSGYEGSGETTCTDIDGCAPNPCFPRVVCTDVPAPGDGYTCAACPEGYRGDGEACEKCILEMGIVSSTVVSGKVKSSFRNQVIANLAGLSDQECVPSSETTFYWAGSASDGSLLTLNDEQNKARTLRLNFPKSTLTTYLAYTLTLTAYITASPEALMALVTPSELQTGQDSQVFLDACASYDPDNEPEDMSFTWRCVRADATGHCRDRDGALLPSVWTGSTIRLSLEGSPEGVAYTFTLQVRKGARESEAAAAVTMTSGPLPVPAIAALPNKVNPNEKVVLTSTVNSSDPGTLSLRWTAKPEAGTAALDLASVATTALTLAKLAVRPDKLQAGGAYIFQLNVEDSIGPATTSLRVVVNEPPSQGGLTVEPSEGTVLNTMFQMVAFGWVDEDTPLWYQMGYVVTGTSSSEMLNEFQPVANVKSMLPQEGMEEHAQEVTVYVHVQDALGALASSSASVAVWPAAAESDAQYVDNQMAVSETAAANGDVDTSVLIVDSLAMALNRNSAERRRRRRALLRSADAAAERTSMEAEQAAERTRQRQSMMGVVEGARDNLQATDSSLERLTTSTQKVVDDPEEVDPALQRAGFSMMEGVVSEAASTESDAGITAGTTAAVGGALSSLVLAGVLNPSEDAGAPNPAAQGLSTLEAMGSVLAAGMVDGEEAATVDASVLSMAVRQESLSDPNSEVFGSPLVTPSGSAVSFPRSIGGVVGGGSTAIHLLTSTVDPHINISSNATEALRRLLLEQEELLGSEAPSSVSAAVTSISLIDASGQEIQIHGLEEGISFTLPLENPNSANGSAAPPQCVFWDLGLGRYDGEGCAALPNPRPRGVELIWRTLNASEVGGELNRMWTIDASSWFVEACNESFDALYPEYLSMDEGMRKYIGEGCVAADPDNNASCWWQWDAEAFFGHGCEWDSELHCLCTHLTDFKATQEQEVGTLAPPKCIITSLQVITIFATVASTLANTGTPLKYLVVVPTHTTEAAELHLRSLQDAAESFEGIKFAWLGNAEGEEEFSGLSGTPVARRDPERATMLALREELRHSVQREQDLRAANTDSARLSEAGDTPEGSIPEGIYGYNPTVAFQAPSSGAAQPALGVTHPSHSIPTVGVAPNSLLPHPLGELTVEPQLAPGEPATYPPGAYIPPHLRPNATTHASIPAPPRAVPPPVVNPQPVTAGLLPTAAVPARGVAGEIDGLTVTDLDSPSALRREMRENYSGNGTTKADKTVML
ncbi:hypothetical protein CYMTET_35770 [Cymbomonas tetramitiformis]|uniref:EGF-like domain-containing protein n=1 Tax=Cymbomonas tetramitiformis TaxID=36881 RepID=A0AAE0KNR3_9CHLO|nr:hypothetical protein CYMTET_35770 [Cymbomonas tetramitiformis]